jgi:hypothetical protein
MGWLIAIAAAGYCYWDSQARRMKNPALWALFGFICNIFAIAILHGNRWLKEGESRSGGRGWDSCRWFAICSTIFFFFGSIFGLGNVASNAPSSSDSAASAGYAIGTTLGMGMIFFLWVFVSGAALLVGLMLRKKSDEVGPTGPLAAAHLAESSREAKHKNIRYDG